MKLETIHTKIYELRGQKIMIDFDLAELYQTETKRLKEAVKRNAKRFPSDFMFEITKEEYAFLRTQFASLETGKGKYSKYMPYAFTEQGVAMLSGVLNSDVAIDVNIAIMRAFITLKQYALTNNELSSKLKELESTYNTQFKDVYEAINYLLNKDKQTAQQQERSKIGYVN